MPSAVVSPRTYFKTFGALLGLLAVTVGASFLPLGPFAVAVALLIALVKAALILLIFMEVRYSPPLVWLFATAASVWLLILLTLSMADYATRAWSQPDWRRENNGVNHLEFQPEKPAR